MSINCRSFLFLGILITFILSGCQIEKIQESGFQRNINFNNDWKFIHGDIDYAEKVEYDDSEWRTVHLPHDISVEDHPVQDSLHVGPFYKGVERGGDVGYFMGGTAWYRKHFIIPESGKNKQFLLNFDGIQSECLVYVNGEKVFRHVYGYTPFNISLTPFLKAPGEDNVLAIRVTNPGVNSRWFTGFGIYRDVTLYMLNPVHFVDRGVYITTPGISETEASINLAVQVSNENERNDTINLLAEILAPDRSIASTVEKQVILEAGQTHAETLLVSVNNPALWQINSPALYTARLMIKQDDLLMDEYTVDFGIRSIDFSAERGFQLNGKQVLLKGANLHHDNGLLGAAAFERAEYRRVEIMKKNGFNSIRTSHNPPSKHFLKACDRLGMLVIDEAFDMWELPKRRNDYHLYFKKHWEFDLEAMMLRDRNHPCIIMWSFGNETKERSRSRGLEIAKMLGDKIRSIDSTRPNTQSVCDFWDNPGMTWDEHTPATFAVTDIAGYNYEPFNYEPDHEKYPDRIMYGSESHAKDAFIYWKMVTKLPYVIGDYIWTGMDYMGESGIGVSKYISGEPNIQHPQPWPWFNANCGDIDLTGNKKPQSYYRDVLWNESDLEILVHEPIPEGKREFVDAWGWPREEPHWNWEGSEGDTLEVNVYSTLPLVKLYLNNKFIGEKEIDLRNGITAGFKVPYKPGELKATARGQDNMEKSKVLTTTGKVSNLNLSAERNTIQASHQEIVYVNLSAIDEEKRLVPNTTLPVEITLDGEGTLLAAGNGSPLIEGSIQDNEFNFHRGRGLIIIRSTGKAGNIALTVKSENGLSDRINIKTVE